MAKRGPGRHPCCLGIATRAAASPSALGDHGDALMTRDRHRRVRVHICPAPFTTLSRGQTLVTRATTSKELIPMAASLIVEEESGTYDRTPHAHNGYFAGDFTDEPMLTNTPAGSAHSSSRQARPGTGGGPLTAHLAASWATSRYATIGRSRTRVLRRAGGATSAAIGTLQWCRRGETGDPPWRSAVAVPKPTMSGEPTTSPRHRVPPGTRRSTGSAVQPGRGARRARSVVSAMAVERGTCSRASRLARRSSRRAMVP